MVKRRGLATAVTGQVTPHRNPGSAALISPSQSPCTFIQVGEGAGAGAPRPGKRPRGSQSGTEVRSGLKEGPFFTTQVPFSWHRVLVDLDLSPSLPGSL